MLVARSPRSLARAGAIALVICTGCDGVFGLASLERDAPSSGDDGSVIDGVPGAPDEDLDGLDDLHDPCPTDPGTSPDSDGDNVGDRCDAHPSMKDRLVAFYGFRELPDALHATTTAGPGSASLVDGSLIVQGMGADQVFTLLDDTALVNATVIARLASTSPPPVQAQRQIIGLPCSATSAGPTPNAHVVEVVDDHRQVSETTSGQLAIYTGGSSPIVAPGNAVTFPRTPATMRADCDGSAGTITGQLDDQSVVAIASLTLPRGSGGLRIVGTDLVVEWLAIYTTDPP